MNPLAQQALDRARESAAPALIVPIQANPPLPELVITGPINRVMELEAKRWALDFVQGLGASIRREPVRTKAIANSKAGPSKHCIDTRTKLARHHA